MVQQQPEERRPVIQQGHQRRLEISSANTTLIGDYVATVYPEFHNKWLVQAQGNATFGSTLELIKQGLVTVDRRYVFFALGGNQIHSANAESMFNWVLNLVVIVREKSKESRIFFNGILPRPVDNDQVKYLIAKANRWLANSIDRISKLFCKVSFLPVQLEFLNGNVPKQQLYSDDRLTLNEAGAAQYRATVFRLAGFMPNKY